MTSLVHPFCTRLCALLVLVLLCTPVTSALADEPAAPKITRAATTTPPPIQTASTIEELRLSIHLKQTARAKTLLTQTTPSQNPYNAARLLLMKTQVALQDGDGQRALSHLKLLEDPAYTDLLQPVAPYLLLLKARAESTAGNPFQAAVIHSDLLQKYPNTLPAHYAHAERADALYNAAQYEQAADAYNTLLARYPEYPRTHRALYRRGLSLLAAGDTKRGMRVLHEVWLQFPWKHEATQARLTLDTLGLVTKTPPNPSYDTLFERARQLRLTKHWESADDALQSLLKRAKTPQGHSERENSIHLQLALLAYDQQYYERALNLLNLLDRASQTPATSAGLNRSMIRKFLQRCHYRMGNVADAERILKERIRSKGSKDQQEALHTFYLSIARYPEALKAFNKAYGTKEKRSFKYAFLNFKAGNHKKALSLLKTLLNKARASKTDRYLYWMARVHHTRGEEDEARTLWTRVTRENPFSYYAYQSANRLLELDRSKTTPDLPEKKARVYWSGPDKDPAPPTTSLRTFLKQSPNTLLTPYLSPQPLIGAIHEAAETYGAVWPELRTAALLHDIGMSYEARYELRDASLEFYELMKRRRDGDEVKADKPLPLKNRRWAHHVDHRRTEVRGFWGIQLKGRRYPIPRSSSGRTKIARRQSKIIAQYATIQPILKRAMMEVGDFHLTRRLRQHEGGWDRTSTSGSNQRIWSELHPRAFAPILQKYAAKENLNPMMLWALMTVESAYNPDSISYADARGLLQVIPKTGNRVAADIRDNDFGPYDLLDPETSLRHGAWYFARLLRKFHGQEPLAIASYNGGPHNVQQWLLHKHHLPLDEFVEEIPFGQARGYTKKVLRFIALYRSIYDNNYGLYVGQKLRADRLDDPRY